MSLLSPTQPLSQRDNHPQQGLRLRSSALLPQTLGLYRQAREFCEGWTNHVKGQIVICHSCTNHVKGEILIYHSCTNQVKGQVIIRFIVTGVYGDHTLSTHRNQESQSKVLINNLGHALISSARGHLSSKPQS